MKILWHSNAAHVPTGYGQQTALFTPRLRALGHDVAVSAVWGLGGAGLEWDGIRVFPADDAWGNRTLAAWAAHHGDGDPEDCQVISLIDVWPLDTSKMPPRMACWCPVDHKPVPPAVRDFFVKSKAQPIAMSRFGEAELRKAGLDPLYVPHGFDGDVFFPRDESRRRDAREDAGIPEGAFVVGMVAANKGTSPSRKAFPEVFDAFARFREQHRDAFLYVHADAASQHGINLRSLARACGLPLSSMKFTDHLNLELGVRPQSLADLMAAFDVLANPSYGEGFGVPIVEAQACGTPVVVSDWTAMPELCGAGWKVGGQRWYDATQDSWFLRPSIDELVAAFEKAYEQAARLRNAAARFARQYDADHVTEEFWKPVLMALDRDRVLAEAVAA